VVTVGPLTSKQAPQSNDSQPRTTPDKSVPKTQYLPPKLRLDGGENDSLVGIQAPSTALAENALKNEMLVQPDEGRDIVSIKSAAVQRWLLYRFSSLVADVRVSRKERAAGVRVGMRILMVCRLDV
jgi:hypothetical protein